MFEFWGKVLRIALSDTIRFLGLSLARVMRTVIVVGVTAAILWMLGSGSDKFAVYQALAISVPLAFAAVFLVNCLRAPAKVYSEQRGEINALQGRVAELDAQTAQRKVNQTEYEALQALYAEGELLLTRRNQTLDSGISTTEWAESVSEWRRKTRDALPSEKDAFWNISTPERFAGVDKRGKVMLLSEQLNKLRRILSRIEEEIR